MQKRRTHRKSRNSNRFSKSTRSKSTRSRSLFAEPLEARRMLAADALSISGNVFIDADQNGAMEVGEQSADGWLVWIDANDNSRREADELFDRTNASGEYCIDVPGPGSYNVRRGYDEAYTGTSIKNTVTVDGVDPTVLDFGLVEVSQSTTTPADRTMGDIDGDGVVDSTDLGILLNNFGQAKTEWEEGNLDDLPVVDSDDLGLLLNQFENEDDPAVEVETGTARGWAWDNLNGNGRRDVFTQDPASDEPYLVNRVVYADLNSNQTRDSNEPAGVTNETGRYVINDIPVGTYWFRIELINNESVTPGFVRAIIRTNQSSTLPAMGVTAGATITGTAFSDENANGIQDAGEPGLAGWQVWQDFPEVNHHSKHEPGEFRPEAGEPGAITSSDGSFTLTGVTPGTGREIFARAPDGSHNHVLFGGGGTESIKINTVPGQTTSNVNFAFAPQGIASQMTVVLRNLATNTRLIGYTYTTGLFANPTRHFVVDADVPAQADAYLDWVVTTTPSGTTLHHIETNRRLTENASGDLVLVPEASAGASWEMQTYSDGSLHFRSMESGRYLSAVPGTRFGQFDIALTEEFDPSANWTVFAAPSDDATSESLTITGSVFDDLNQNGQLDADEVGLADRVVWVDTNNDFQRNTNEPFAQTDSEGAYSIVAEAGNHIVRIEANDPAAIPRYEATNRISPFGGTQVAYVALTEGSPGAQVDFGQAVAGDGLGHVEGIVFDDVDSDGIQQTDGFVSEGGVPGRVVWVDLDGNGRREAGEPFDVTNARGVYRILDVPLGQHTVRIAGMGDWSNTTSTAFVTQVEANVWSSGDFGQFSPTLSHLFAEGVWQLRSREFTDHYLWANNLEIIIGNYDGFCGFILDGPRYIWGLSSNPNVGGDYSLGSDWIVRTDEVGTLLQSRATGQYLASSGDYDVQVDSSFNFDVDNAYWHVIMNDDGSVALQNVATGRYLDADNPGNNITATNAFDLSDDILLDDGWFVEVVSTSAENVMMGMHGGFGPGCMIGAD